MKIASFIVQRFGQLKGSDPNVLSTLVKIVSRYDIIVILEEVDVSTDSVKLFMEELNRVNTEHHYALQLSSRLGGNQYKQQFLFLYRDDVIDLIESYQYEERDSTEYHNALQPRISLGTIQLFLQRYLPRYSTFLYQYEDNQVNAKDALAREPYILHFKPHNTVLKDIMVIPVHTKPRQQSCLNEVFLLVKDKWKTDNIMILGDFNTDGVYVTNEKMKGICIRNDNNFHWLIGDDVNTTANMPNEHTYDRIVVYGKEMLAAIVPNTAKPFNFQKEFAMTEEEALGVSDHYPVEVELHEAPPFWLSRSDCIDTQGGSVNRAVTESLQIDVLKLQRENLLLEREKLQLQISLLNQQK